MAQIQIIDNIILVQEVIHISKIHKENGMAIKIDMANAFNHVSHSFLLQVLAKFGLCLAFIHWIEIFINNPQIYPLVNMRPTSFSMLVEGFGKVVLFLHYCI